MTDAERMPSWTGEPYLDETDGRWYRNRLSGCLGWREEVVPAPDAQHAVVLDHAGRQVVFPPEVEPHE